MKHYTIPAFVVFLCGAMFFFAVERSFERANRAIGQLKAGEQAMDLARARLSASQRSATAAKARSGPADAFLETWTAELQAESNIEGIFGRLDTLAVNNLLSPSGKNFTSNMNYFFNGSHLPVQNVNITVAGDFVRTLNWLGAVESAFPLGRIEQISYSANGNSLLLAVQFVFPRKFEVQ